MIALSAAALALALLAPAFAPDALLRLARPRRHRTRGLMPGVGVPSGRILLVVTLPKGGRR